MSEEEDTTTTPIATKIAAALAEKTKARAIQTQLLAKRYEQEENKKEQADESLKRKYQEMAESQEKIRANNTAKLEARYVSNRNEYGTN
jgi:hypothetical protein